MSSICGDSAAADANGRYGEPLKVNIQAANDVWLADLRAEARIIAGEALNEKAQGLLKFAEDTMKEFDKEQLEATQRLEADLRRCRQSTERMQQDKCEMLEMISIMKERLDSMEVAARAAGAVLPPFDELGPLLESLGVGSAGRKKEEDEPTTPRTTPPPRRIAVDPPPGLGVMTPEPVPAGKPALAPGGFGMGAGTNPAWLDGSKFLSPPLRPVTKPPVVPFPGSPVFMLSEMPEMPPSCLGALEPQCRRPIYEDEEDSGNMGNQGKSPFMTPMAGSTMCRSPFASPISEHASPLYGPSPTPLTKFVERTLPSPHRGYGGAGTLAAAGLRLGVERTPPGTPVRTLTLTPSQSRRAHGSLTKSPMVPASPFVPCESGGCVFGFTLRVAHGSKVGLSLQAGADESLLVMEVNEDGAIAAWNKQCVSGPNAGKQIQAGDRIVGINGASTAAEMLKECRERQLLKVMVVRGAPECAIPWTWMLGDMGRSLGQRRRCGSDDSTGGLEPSAFPMLPPPPPSDDTVMGILSNSFSQSFSGPCGDLPPPLPMAAGPPPGLSFPSADGVKARI